MTSEILKEAIALARHGDKDQARRILAEIIEDDVHNEMAWLWYADTMAADDAKVRALRECLYHNPDSEPARRGLERLGAQWEEIPPGVEEEEAPEPEPEPEPVPPPLPWAEPVRPIPEPPSQVGADPVDTARSASRRRSGLGVIAYLVAAVVGAIVLAYAGLYLVTGVPIASLAELQAAAANSTALMVGLLCLALGALVGVLLVWALLTRPRRTG